MFSNVAYAVDTSHHARISELLQQLAESGYVLQVKEKNLHVSHANYPLSAQLQQCLKKDKAAIIQLLTLKANVNPCLVNEPVAIKPAILFSVWEVSLTNNPPMTVISRDDHTLQCMTKAMQRQFGAHRIASITMVSCYAK